MLRHVKKAYTLLEITIVVVIIVILTAGIGWRFRRIDHGRETARLLEGHFSRLKNRAATREQHLDLVIDLGQSHYYGVKEDGGLFLETVEIPKNVKIRFIPIRDEEHEDPFELTEDRVAIRFSPDARCSLRNYHDNEETVGASVQVFVMHFTYGNLENWMMVDGRGALWKISSTPFALNDE